ncbi:unnamed protein product [Adineta steineri]|uniref:4-alpha-glucanotransferase n=1 Tax=Adineta steineri TaxID=433720 RepID=A0A813ZJP9_9BILA|nr:unnamed protein product [Adineta steineri]CAF3592526.1 unnamed protein product [Adineta steineri]
MKLERSSGVLVHITSLPSKYGIGDFGREAFKFIDFLFETKQKLWQILPLTITNSPSPYSCISSFAGNPWLISPEILLENNFLTENDLNFIDKSKIADDYVNFKYIKEIKENLLKKALKNFEKLNENWKTILNEFYENEKYWIDDFILFMILKNKYNEGTWSDWPHQYRSRDKLSLDKLRQDENHHFQYYLFVQYIFYQQWNQLKTYANNHKIQIIGDIPIYLDYHSTDVWTNQHLFQLDQQTFKPTVVSGFPSSDKYDIQIWNQPIYKWNDKSIRNDLFQWWINRLSKTLKNVNILRIDHFRGFISHYVIPIDMNTSKPIISNAHWINTPGYELFTEVRKSLGSDIPIIVEDIGDVTLEVFNLRDHFHFYGIRILQMGFNTYPDNIYAPHNYIYNSFAYTGTHDNATTLEWWKKLATEKEKEQFIEYIRYPFKNENQLELEKYFENFISWIFIQLVLQSSSNGAILHMPDILNTDIRMNYPGNECSLEKDGRQNWSWRFQWSQLTSDRKNELKRLTIQYGRDLIYGKSIPPKDMIMKNDQSFFNKQINE